MWLRHEYITMLRIDCFDKKMLAFDVLVKKKFWGGKIEIYPDEIEYIWE